MTICLRASKCPLCGGEHIETISEVSLDSGLKFLATGVCKDCDFVFRNIRPKLSWFEKSWEHREVDSQAVWQQAHNKDWEQKRYDRYEKGGLVVAVLLVSVRTS